MRTTKDASKPKLGEGKKAERGQRKNLSRKPSKKKVGEVGIWWFDSIPIEEAAYYMALDSIVRDGTVSPEQLLDAHLFPHHQNEKAAQDYMSELHRRTAEAMGRLIVTLSAARGVDDTPESRATQAYAVSRMHKYRFREISSSEGQALWDQIWAKFEGDPLIEELKKKAFAGELEKSNESWTFDDWKDNVVRNAAKSFGRFVERIERAASRAKFMLSNPEERHPTSNR